MAGLSVSVAPSSEPLTTSQVKSHLRVEHSDDDTLIGTLIVAAREFVEEYTGRALMTQTLVLNVDAFDELADPLWEGTRTGPYLNYYKDYITIPKPPVVSVTSVKTFDDDDTATTMSSSKYYLDNVREPARVVLRTGETFPTALRVANAIQVKYVTGYASAGAVPEAIKQAMKQYIAFLYENRGDVNDNAAPMVVKKLLAPYVVHSGLGSSTFMQIG